MDIQEGFLMNSGRVTEVPYYYGEEKKRATPKHSNIVPMKMDATFFRKSR